MVCKNTLEPKIWLIGFLLFSSCEFSKSPGAQEVSAQNVPGNGASKARLSLNWSGSGEEMRMSGILDSKNTVQFSGFVTLPKEFPEVLVLKIPFDEKIKKEPEIVSVSAEGTDLSDNTFLLAVDETDFYFSEAKKTGVRFLLYGFEALLNSKKKAVGEIKIKVYYDETLERTYEFAVRTPPSEVFIDTYTNGEVFETTDFQDEIQDIQYAGSRYHLIQSFNFTNEGEEPIDLNLRVSDFASVRQKKQIRNITNYQCSHQVEKQFKSVILSKDVFLVPLTSQLVSEIQKIHFMGGDYPGMRTFRVGSESSRLFGVYARGRQIDSLTDIGPASSVFQKTQAVQECKLGDCVYYHHDTTICIEFEEIQVFKEVLKGERLEDVYLFVGGAFNQLGEIRYADQNNEIYSRNVIIHKPFHTLYEFTEGAE